MKNVKAQFENCHEAKKRVKMSIVLLTDNNTLFTFSHDNFFFNLDKCLLQFYLKTKTNQVKSGIAINHTLISPFLYPKV